MGKMSKEKGKRAERELAGILRGYGYDCHRGQQYNGADGSADVVGLPGIHIECKRVEKLNLYEAVNQAVADSIEGLCAQETDDIPAVFHRKNNRGWLVTMRLDDWIEIYREYEANKETEEN